MAQEASQTVAPPEFETVRDRMQALGWGLCVDDDNCSTGWVKIRNGTAVAYGHEYEFNRDLERSTEDHRAAGGRFDHE